MLIEPGQQAASSNMLFNAGTTSPAASAECLGYSDVSDRLLPDLPFQLLCRGRDLRRRAILKVDTGAPAAA